MRSGRRRSVMLKTYKYRLYPNKEQKRKLNETLWLCAMVYNRCLAERRDVWKNEQRSLTAYYQIKQLPIWKKEDPRLNQVYSQVLQDVVRRVDGSEERRVGNEGR